MRAAQKKFDNHRKRANSFCLCLQRKRGKSEPIIRSHFPNQPTYVYLFLIILIRVDSRPLAHGPHVRTAENQTLYFCLFMRQIAFGRGEREKQKRNHPWPGHKKMRLFGTRTHDMKRLKTNLVWARTKVNVYSIILSHADWRLHIFLIFESY